MVEGWRRATCPAADRRHPGGPIAGQHAFEIQRVLDLVQHYRNDSAMQIVDNLYHAVRAFTRNEPQIDDISVVVLKVGPAS
jgi:hypothetical protein